MTTKKAGYAEAFAALKPVLEKFEKRLAVKTDAATEYTLVTKSPSPYPQHKGQPMWFGCVKVGRAYASFHLLPLYMNPALTKTMAPALKKRMQGKACFNFKAAPEKDALVELKRLTEASFKEWAARKYL